MDGLGTMSEMEWTRAQGGKKLMTEQSIGIGWAEGQSIEGWVTITWLEEEGKNVVYGMFEDEASAQEWAKHMRAGTVVRPICTPRFSVD